MSRDKQLSISTLDKYQSPLSISHCLPLPSTCSKILMVGRYMLSCWVGWGGVHMHRKWSSGVHWGARISWSWSGLLWHSWLLFESAASYSKQAAHTLDPPKTSAGSFHAIWGCWRLDEGHAQKEFNLHVLGPYHEIWNPRIDLHQGSQRKEVLENLTPLFCALLIIHGGMPVHIRDMKFEKQGHSVLSKTNKSLVSSIPIDHVKSSGGCIGLTEHSGVGCYQSLSWSGCRSNSRKNTFLMREPQVFF